MTEYELDQIVGGGNLIPTDEPFGLLWPRWVEAFTAWQESRDPTTHRPLPYGGIVIDIPDKVTIAMAGDWGTGCGPATTTIRDLMIAENPDITIHLGDVYVSGQPAENAAFAAMWPAGKLGSFNLTSNHDGYSGFSGYLQTLADPKFAAQQSNPYFALRNQNFIIAALDTTSHSQSFLYKEGFVDPSQLKWLNGLIGGMGTRKLILLTHHDPFNLAVIENAGSTTHGLIYKPLYGQLPKAERTYFGHIHAPLVFSRGYRCIGHGGIPYLPFPGFYKDYGDDLIKVEWTETEAVSGLRGAAGYMVVRLDGETITEQLIDERGLSRWSQS